MQKKTIHLIKFLLAKLIYWSFRLKGCCFDISLFFSLFFRCNKFGILCINLSAKANKGDRKIFCILSGIFFSFQLRYNNFAQKMQKDCSDSCEEVLNEISRQIVDSILKNDLIHVSVGNFYHLYYYLSFIAYRSFSTYNFHTFINLLIFYLFSSLRDLFNYTSFYF